MNWVALAMDVDKYPIFHWVACLMMDKLQVEACGSAKCLAHMTTPPLKWCPFFHDDGQLDRNIRPQRQTAHTTFL